MLRGFYEVGGMGGVGRDGAMQLISEEMSNKYFWQNMTFPKMMEERGFPKNKSDGVENYYYR